MNDYAPGDSFFVIIDDELLICDILDYFSSTSVRINLSKDPYLTAALKYTPFQTVEKSYLDEICISMEELFDYLQVDLVDT